MLVWISGWMVVLRLLASHFVERLAPTGMLLSAAILTGTGLFLLSFVQGLWSALAVATIFAKSSSRRSGVSFLLSFNPWGMRAGSSLTAATTTGPASGPRPASSTSGK